MGKNGKGKIKCWKKLGSGRHKVENDQNRKDQKGKSEGGSDLEVKIPEIKRSRREGEGGDIVGERT